MIDHEVEGGKKLSQIKNARINLTNMKREVGSLKGRVLFRERG